MDPLGTSRDSSEALTSTYPKIVILFCQGGKNTPFLQLLGMCYNENESSVSSVIGPCPPRIVQYTTCSVISSRPVNRAICQRQRLVFSDL